MVSSRRMTSFCSGMIAILLLSGIAGCASLPPAGVPGDVVDSRVTAATGERTGYSPVDIASKNPHRGFETKGVTGYKPVELPTSTVHRPLRFSTEEEYRLLELAAQAEAAYREGLWADAAALYETVLLSVPHDPYLWFRLGNTLTRQGQYLKAIQAFEQSLQRDSSQPKTWFNLSTTYLLSAQMATMGALEALESDDPARSTLLARLDALSQLLQ